jgi:hypothetical protein
VGVVGGLLCCAVLLQVVSALPNRADVLLLMGAICYQLKDYAQVWQPAASSCQQQLNVPAHQLQRQQRQLLSAAECASIAAGAAADARAPLPEQQEQQEQQQGVLCIAGFFSYTVVAGFFSYTVVGRGPATHSLLSLLTLLLFATLSLHFRPLSL